MHGEIETRLCVICNKQFTATHPKQVTRANPKCRKIRRSRQRALSYQQEKLAFFRKQETPTPEKPKPKKQTYRHPESLDLIAWKAKKAGMSYGHYVALKEPPQTAI